MNTDFENGGCPGAPSHRTVSISRAVTQNSTVKNQPSPVLRPKLPLDAFHDCDYLADALQIINRSLARYSAVSPQQGERSASLPVSTTTDGRTLRHALDLFDRPAFAARAMHPQRIPDLCYGMMISGNRLPVLRIML
ncbi:hypothetical protein [Methylobacterium sp. J-077]|uniref:hypothetical protein n=1 Tax=Methylobacterium sp. J-077 TaxID=2836656 RepID=UPI001FBB2C53|nr:hypothetical protein [Methylobacterium sp. J-077]MCJ2121415.1 hypothetical protein [Methylobacterium sp. J-077]